MRRLSQYGGANVQLLLTPDLVPDIFNRPWAEIRERYHEEGMSRPERQRGRTIPSPCTTAGRSTSSPAW
jgi:hypothetical protein